MRFALALVALFAAVAVACGGPSAPASSAPGTSRPLGNVESTPKAGTSPLLSKAVDEDDGYGGDTYGEPASVDWSEEDYDDEYWDMNGVEGGVEGGVVGGVVGGDYPPPPPPPPPPKGAATAAPTVVPQTVLTELRISGEVAVQPSDETKLKIERDGKAKLVASYKVCVSEAGLVSSVKALKTTGYPDYDAKLEAAIRKWRFRPYMINGKAVPVCTAVTFIYKQV